MHDEECAGFLQWALPQLRMRWSGFRKVRSQVCKRIARRMHQLDIDSVVGYREYLEKYPQEWNVLETSTRVTISRFYRDKAMFAFLEGDVLPVLARQATEQNQGLLRILCIGSSLGEEPYTLAIIWKLRLQSRFPDLRLEIIATDVESTMIQRARRACYQYSSIKNLPVDWREDIFDKQDDIYCLKSAYRCDVWFVEQDIRTELPYGLFDLVLCRNLVFTYYEATLQQEILKRICDVMGSGGALVIGIHEDLPENINGLDVWSDRLRIFRRDIE
jgi:chemotaxis protein methyltransferase CheR